MRLKVTQKDHFHFIGNGAEYSGELPIDAAAYVGGQGKGFRPPEILLFSVAGCMGIHSYEALVKDGRQIDHIIVEADGERADEHPKWFTRIMLKFLIKGGGVTEEEVKGAIEMALSKTCSVAAMVHRVAPISYEIIMR